jgi:hypothetical protein
MKYVINGLMTRALPFYRSMSLRKVCADEKWANSFSGLK